MSVYRFTVEVDGLSPDEKCESRFYGNGVDDALFYVSGGQIFLAFDREAWNQDAAIQSATRDIIERGGRVKRIIWDEPAVEG